MAKVTRLIDKAEKAEEAAVEQGMKVAAVANDAARETVKRAETAAMTVQHDAAEAIEAFSNGVSTVIRGVEEIQLAWLEIFSRSFMQMVGPMFSPAMLGVKTTRG